MVSVTFRKLPPERIIALTVESGLKSIEWGGDVHVPPGDLARAGQIRALCRQVGLIISAYGSYYRVGLSEKNGASFSSVLKTAEELGTDTIRVWAGNLGSADAPPGFRQSVINDLKRICDLAGQAGLTISLEFHGGTLTDTAESTAALIADTATPNLTTYWQPSNGMPTDECLAGLRIVLPHLQNMHIFHWWPDDKHRLALSDGVDRWRQYLKLAAESGRTRYVSLEFVRGDDLQQFHEDAKTLHLLLSQF